MLTFILTGLLCLPTALGARGVCRQLIRPRNYDPDGMEVRIFVPNGGAVDYTVVANPDGDHVYEHTAYFDDVEENSVAFAETRVDNNGVFSIQANFDNELEEDGELDNEGNIIFQHSLKCRILPERDGLVVNWIGVEKRTLANDCFSLGLTKRRVSPACKQICYQCLQFKSPNKIYEYDFKFSNQYTATVKGKNIEKLYCYFHNKDVRDVVAVTRTDKMFSSRTTVKLVKDKWISVLGGQVQMTETC